MTRTAAVIALTLALTACGAGDSEEAADPSRRTDSTSATDATRTPRGDDAGAGGAESPSPTTGTTEKGGGASLKGTVIITADSQYGPMLFDRTGQAIYLFDKETSSTPRCYGPCADAWPPVLTDSEPRARRGADGALLGTVRRRDGSTQVTYDGRPLYFYADEGKYQVLCHDIREYGGLWLVVTPEGPPAPSET
jgi:predicted lipoprotein with Yx(FWY)xxD motif